MAYMKVVERGLPDKYKDSTTYRDLCSYCLNPEKSVYTGTKNLQSAETASEEMEAIAKQFKKEFGKRISHIILSFHGSELKSASTAAEIAEMCARYYAARYQIIWSVQIDPQVHIHMILNRISFIDGKKYPDRYADRHGFWQHVHQVLTLYGIQLWK